MPLKKLVPSVKLQTKKRQDANNNCTKISNEMIINGSVKNEGEESEFGKATKGHELIWFGLLFDKASPTSQTRCGGPIINLIGSLKT